MNLQTIPERFLCAHHDLLHCGDVHSQSSLILQLLHLLITTMLNAVKQIYVLILPFRFSDLTNHTSVVHNLWRAKRNEW